MKLYLLVNNRRILCITDTGGNREPDIKIYFYQFCSWWWDTILALQVVLEIQFYPEWLEFFFSFAWKKHFIAKWVWKIEVFFVLFPL